MNRRALSLGHALALLAALALMFVMALDWYTTKQGEEFRQTQESFEDARDAGLRERARDAGAAAEDEERNAVDPAAAIDVVLLLVLFATVATTALAAILRTLGVQSRPPLTPIAVAALLAIAAELLVAYRIVQEPGLDAATEVTIAPPLALVCLVLLTFGAFRAMRVEEAEAEGGDGPAEEAPPSPGAPPGPRPPAARTPSP